MESVLAVTSIPYFLQFLPPFHEGVTFVVAEEFGEVTEVLGYWFMHEIAGAFKQVDIRDFQYIIPSHLRPEDQAKLRQMVEEIQMAASSP